MPPWCFGEREKGVHKKEITPREVEEAAEKGVPFINYPKLHRQI